MIVHFLNIKEVADNLYPENDEEYSNRSNDEETEGLVSFIEKDREEEKEDLFLTRKGIINFTNQHRKSYGLNPLTENEKLNAAALKKVEDIFSNQYFAHTSPTGEEAADLVEDVNYEYLLVGENLAKGIFENDEILVEGWMNSPDHRDNILKPGYREIGVASKEGIYMGREVWIAVQIFGTGSDECPRVDESYLGDIEEKKKSMDSLLSRISDLDEEISTTKNRKKYNQLVKERNDLADEYNKLGEDVEYLISIYNQQVNQRKECLKNYGVK